MQLKTQALARGLAAIALMFSLSMVGCNGDTAAERDKKTDKTTKDGKGAKGNEGRDPETLNVALLPDEEASKVIEDNEGLQKYLEEKLGKSIKLTVLPNYTAMIEAVRAKHIDLAYFGPLSYCIAVDKGADIHAFSAKTKGGSPTYTSVVIANVESGINSVEGIKGKNMGYGDPASTSSHLIPKGVLAKGGVKEDDYEEQFLGKHDIVAKTCETGAIQAGGLSKPIWDGLVEDGKIDTAKVKVIAESDPIPQYPWAMQNDLAPELQTKIKTAFLELKDEAILKPLKAEGFAEIDDKDYNSIRDAAKILGKDLNELSKQPATS
ncbi:MAG: phosphate/phosphite/phosphonate ABC transporter substrate-binding protein [Pirellulales bacterium]|nr:phosphate/phosphite/phosphonate ABC transporter substrate-binding protein [Pirellulales bacterium]